VIFEIHQFYLNKAIVDQLNFDPEAQLTILQVMVVIVIAKLGWNQA